MAKKRRNQQQTPHDKLFKAIYSHPENAAAHLRTFLPEALADALDLSAAELVPGTFLDDSLPGRRTDVLYRIPRKNKRGERSDGRDVLLFAVLEHQSTIDELMAFRMYRYVVRIWERWLADHPQAKRLPPVVPLVLYHGQRRWTAALELTELVDLEGLAPEGLEELRRYQPALSLMLQDLGTVPDAGLPHHPVVRLTLLLFKHGREPGLLELLEKSREELTDLAETGAPGLRAFGFLLQYMLTVNDHVNEEALASALAALGPEVGEMAMTEYERLIERGRKEGIRRGRQEGRQEGWQEGKACVARRMLAKGMSIDEVAELAELPVDEVRKLTQ